jgi:hypothetical protein
VYLGQAETRPAFPDWPWLSVPAANRLVTRHGHDCNFVQVLEGLVDSSHLGVLHANSLRASAASDLTFANKVGVMQFDLAPRIEVEDTDFGFHYAALRTIATPNGERTLARVTAFVAPCTVLNPNGDVVTIVVPNNDERCSFFHVFWDSGRRIGEEPLRTEHLKFIGLDPQTARAYGLTSDVDNSENGPSRTNRFHQDRDAMRRRDSFSGLPGLIEEDVAVSVSAGAIRDRAREMLSVSDVAVGRLYKVLLKCARQAEEGGDAIGTQLDAAHIVGTHGELEHGKNWRSLVPQHRAVGRGTMPAGSSAAVS